MNNLCTIRPVLGEQGKPTPTQGTRVILADGSELGGVQSIEITGKSDDVWRARISCLVTMDEMIDIDGEITERRVVLTWWRRMLLRAAGVTASNITAMGHQANRWEAMTRKWSNEDVQS